MKGQKLFLHHENIKINTVFAKDTEFEGELVYSYPLKIQGKFKGKIRTDSFLWIDNEAEIEGDIVAGSVKLGGLMKGNIYAKNKVELLASARLYGGIKTNRIKVADGVLFEGNCEMLS